jgi:hypothetical protein
MLTRRLIQSAFLFSLLLAYDLAFSTPVLADANGPSCMGIESSSISPPGSSPEETGGRVQFENEIKELAGQLNIPSGAVISGFARVHAGSHDLCDAAAG